MKRTLRSKKLRALLYYEQDGKCAICGEPLPDDWHADHVVPWSKTQRTNVHEMQALCPDCNLEKGTKMLRKHQRELQEIAQRIRVGEPIDEIIVHVTPGGGKSALPMILSKEIAEPLKYKICWVVPRDALRRQAERGFVSPFMRSLIGHKGKIRASGNDARPTRGTFGYVTTYQAIAAHPELHEQEFQLHNYILFLDECHHIPEKGTGEEAAYFSAIAPLVERARLLVFASGTLGRHDGHRIAFLPYTKIINGEMVDATETLHRRVIKYSRRDALEEGAIVPLHFHVMDGHAQWLNPTTGELRNVESIAESEVRDQSAIIRTILETHYAYELLNKCLGSWQEHKTIVYSNAKVLVVAPTISVAKDYCRHINSLGHSALIATSDDSPAAKQNIERFKGNHRAGEEVDILVTVGMAYEGLDVPQITHVACLTNIRSRFWLEQCFCRANRTADDKTHGYIFIPDDVRMKEIVQAIEAEQAAVVITWPKEKIERTGSSERTELVRPEPIDSDVTRERAQGIEDGTQTSYNETAAIVNAMSQAKMRGISVIQAKQFLTMMGAGIVPNSNEPPNYTENVLTPSELEQKLKQSEDRTVKRIAKGDPQAIRDIYTELSGTFGPKGEATVEVLQLRLRYLDEKYGGVTA